MQNFQENSENPYDNFCSTNPFLTSRDNSSGTFYYQSSDEYYSDLYEPFNMPIYQNSESVLDNTRGRKLRSKSKSCDRCNSRSKSRSRSRSRSKSCDRCNSRSKSRSRSRSKSCKGQKGDKGDKGDMGVGQKGDKGDSGMGVGQKGEKGEKGDKGDKGDNGIGEKGENGEKGEKGDAGIGQKGDKGDTGIGEKGEPGNKGDKGELGQKGDTGSGDKGQKGSQGDIGNKGNPGDKGDKGQKGEKGMKGEKGFGKPGPKGDPGPSQCTKCPITLTEDVEKGDIIRKTTVEPRGRKFTYENIFEYVTITTNGQQSAGIDGLSNDTDINGNVYVCGNFFGTINFGNTISLTSGSFNSAFVAKIDPNGNWLWAVKADSSTGVVTSTDIKCNGNIYVTGTFETTGTFGNIQVMATNSSRTVYIAKILSDGNWESVINANGQNSVDTFTGNSNSISLRCDIDTVYITGSYRGTGVFNQLPPINSGARITIFVAAAELVNNMLMWKWVITAAGTGEGTGIASDENGSIYIIGNYITTVIFDSFSLAPYSAETSDIFIVKLVDETTGSRWIWGIRAGGDDSEDIGRDITLSCKGVLFAIGDVDNTSEFGNITISPSVRSIWVGRVEDNGLYGEWIWVKVCGSTDAPCIGNAITSYNNGVYITGCLDGLCFVGQFILPILNQLGVKRLLVAKLDENGQWIWAVQDDGSNPNNIGNSITLDCDGQVYTFGSFGSTQVLNDGVVASKIADDRNAQAVGIATEAGTVGNMIDVIYCCGSIIEIYTDLQPGYNYYIDNNGNISTNCKCPRCPRYIGFACSETELFFKPICTTPC